MGRARERYAIKDTKSKEKKGCVRREKRRLMRKEGEKGEDTPLI